MSEAEWLRELSDEDLDQEIMMCRVRSLAHRQAGRWGLAWWWRWRALDGTIEALRRYSSEVWTEKQNALLQLSVFDELAASGDLGAAMTAVEIAEAIELAVDDLDDEMQDPAEKDVGGAAPS